MYFDSDIVNPLRYLESHTKRQEKMKLHCQIAESIDNLYLDGIVASIAGDNVVLVITADQKNAKQVAKAIEEYIE